MNNWKTYFEEISRIPRCSGEETAIGEYLYRFGRERNLKTLRDDAGNILIIKPATSGYENAPGTILQAHMDMVCVKDRQSGHDFSKDPIALIEEKGYLRAEGTTLGADNGVGVAMILAVLDDPKAKHPKLEAVFTTEEEVGLKGASGLNANALTGQCLINLDGEEEGTFIASCAGGVRTQLRLGVGQRKAPKGEAYHLIIEGLKGGHSGLEIHEERANALVLMGRLLRALPLERLALFNLAGGEKPNAIADWSRAGLVVSKDRIPKLKKALEDMEKQFRGIFAHRDPDIVLRLERTDQPAAVYDEKTKQALLHLLALYPNGIHGTSPFIEGLVETSCNLGFVSRIGDDLVFEGAIRSAKEEEKRWLLKRLDELGGLLGLAHETSGDYPAWRFRQQSKLRDLVLETYRKMGGEPEVAAIHAGLECGVLLDKLPSVDALSFGPTIEGAHTVRERLNLASADRTMVLLLKSLAELNRI